MSSSIEAVVTSAASLAKIVKLVDGFVPKVKDLNNTPNSIEQGDNPQVFFHPRANKAQRLTFDGPNATHHARRDFTVITYFIDTMEMVPVWASRVRTTTWCDAFVEAVNGSDSLGIDDCYVEANAEVRDGLEFNKQQFRGAIITLTGWFFT